MSAYEDIENWIVTQPMDAAKRSALEIATSIHCIVSKASIGTPIDETTLSEFRRVFTFDSVLARVVQDFGRQLNSVRDATRVTMAGFSAFSWCHLTLKMSKELRLIVVAANDIPQEQKLELLEPFESLPDPLIYNKWRVISRLVCDKFCGFDSDALVECIERESEDVYALSDVIKDADDSGRSSGGVEVPSRRTKPMSLAEAGTILNLGPSVGSKDARRKAAGQAMRRLMDSGGFWFEAVGNKFVFDADRVR